jgi:hypothetical protein
VLGRLVADATLTDEARRMGLGISNESLSREIAGDTAFQDPSGNFDRDAFVQLLQNAGLTEDQYVEELRTGYTRQQIRRAAGETGPGCSCAPPRVPERERSLAPVGLPRLTIAT